jgi:hypothetical protein
MPPSRRCSKLPQQSGYQQKVARRGWPGRALKAARVLANLVNPVANTAKRMRAQFPSTCLVMCSDEGNGRATRPEMNKASRVAFFSDSFHEVNGVAHTARHFQDYAQRHSQPFLCVHAAPQGVRGGPVLVADASVTTLELPRSVAAIRIERDLSFDPLFVRHGGAIERALRDSKPDVIHLQGQPSSASLPPTLLGNSAFPWLRVDMPMCMSMPLGALRGLAGSCPLQADGSSAALAATARCYRLAKVLYAPNEELCDLLREKTGRPCNIDATRRRYRAVQSHTAHAHRG